MFNKKVGMIGLGSWGKNIYRNLDQFNVVELVYDNNLKNSLSSDISLLGCLW